MRAIPLWSGPFVARRTGSADREDSVPNLALSGANEGREEFDPNRASPGASGGRLGGLGCCPELAGVVGCCFGSAGV